MTTNKAATPQPAPSQSNHKPIIAEIRAVLHEAPRQYFDALMQDLEDRSRMGFDKYGTMLKPFNGRDALVDMYQELLDALMYNLQAMVEDPQDGQLPMMLGALTNLAYNLKLRIVARDTQNVRAI